MYEKFGQFIDGKWQPSEKKETYEVINPATEEVLGHASKATPVDVDRALKSAEKGLEVWKKTSPWKRSSIIRKIADLIRKKQDVLAKWMTLEVGKPLAEGKGEAGGSADIFEWNSEETKRIYGQTVESRFEDTRVHVYYQPVGVVAALVPWNFPLILASSKITGGRRHPLRSRRKYEIDRFPTETLTGEQITVTRKVRGKNLKTGIKTTNFVNLTIDSKI